ncbi:MAG: hypothetical protein LBS36_10885 [Oscillospiraceae bacterium]|nr:hypothetical protein [Oscillospiraceae bacterium]
MSLPKRILSVILSVVMLVTSMTIGFYGLAAELDESQLYNELAALMKNEYVARRSNYSVEHNREMTEEGWVEDSAQFSTRHIVSATDNKDGDIYHAARKFAEAFEYEVSYVYGQGNYDSEKMFGTVAGKLKAKMTEAEYNDYNIEIILDYFLGSSSVINAGSWFHDYVFYSKTDLDAALTYVDSIDDFTENWIDIYECTLSYNFKREWDTLTATKALYSYSGFDEESGVTPDTDTVYQLRKAANFFRNSNTQLWDQTQFAKKSDAELIAWRASPIGQQFTQHCETLSQYSTQVIYNLFGVHIGDIMHLHGNTQPISQVPVREEVRKNPDGSSVPYIATSAMMDTMVTNIDGVLQNDKLSAVMPLLVNSLLGEDFTGNVANFTNLNMLLQELIRQMVYSDEIVNMVFEMLYPMLTEALFTLSFDAGILGTISLGDLMPGIMEDNSIWLLPGTFASKVLTGTYATKYPAIKQELQRASSAAGSNDATSWTYVNWEAMTWGITDRASFQEVLSLVLGGLGTLFQALMCGQGDYRIDIISLVKIWGRDTYKNLMIPLYEALGVSNIPTHDQIKGLAPVAMANAIINPLLNWVEQVFLQKPIETVCNMLPNLVLYLDKDTQYSPYQLIKSTSNDDPFSLIFRIFDVASWTRFYSLSVGDLLDEEIVNALSGINEALKQFISLDTEKPTFDEHGDPVMVLDEETGEYVQATHEVEVTLPTIMEKKLRSCGAEVSYVSASDAVNSRNPKKIQITHPGNVLLYLMRFVFSSLMQRTYDPVAGTFAEASLADAFGLDMEDEIYEGITIGGLVTNLVFNYDDAICALVELFAPNETGYEYDHTKNPTTKAYTYKIKNVEYYNDVLLNRTANNYGPKVKYSEYWKKKDATYLERNLEQLLDNVLSMLKIEDFESINQYLGDMISNMVFTNDMLSNLADMLYGDEGYLSNINDLVAGEEGEPSLDLNKLLKDLFGVELDPMEMGRMLGKRLFGDIVRQSEVSQQLAEAPNEYQWSSSYFYVTNEEGEQVARDWGYADARLNKELGGLYNESELFAMNIGALLSPLAFVFRFLFADQDLKILDLISVAGYAGYQYSMIHLYEMLGVGQEDISTYQEYYEASFDPATGDLNTIELVISPLLKLVDNITAAPLQTILDLIPNIFFMFSTGGVNDIFNNLLHPFYVLLDTLSPIVDVYPIIESLLSGLNVGGMALNLSVPLNLDLNMLINSLLDGALTDALTFEVDGSSLTLFLPPLDVATFCTGTVKLYASIAGYETVKLAGSRADIVTVLLRYVVETLFKPENRTSVKNFIVQWRALDDYDDGTLTAIFDYIGNVAAEQNMQDRSLQIIFMLFTQVLPISTDLSARFKNLPFSITDLLAAVGTDNFSAMLKQLMDAGESTNPTLAGFAKIIALLQEFFNKIGLFFKQIFGG